MRDRRERAYQRQEFASPLLLAVDAVRVDDGYAGPWRERLAEPRHDDLRVHPVQARARRHETVGRVQRSVLGRPLNPADPLVVAAGHPARFAQHGGRRIDRIDALGELRESDGERPGPAARVEHGAGLDEQSSQDLEDFGWVRLAVPVLARDLVILKGAAKLARVCRTHAIAFSRRSIAAPTDARRLPSRSYGHSYFFTTE